MGLAYLMFGLIVSLRVGLAGTYNHGDMLLQMVTESEQVTATRAKKDHMLCARQITSYQMSTGPDEQWAEARSLLNASLSLSMSQNVRIPTFGGLCGGRLWWAWSHSSLSKRMQTASLVAQISSETVSCGLLRRARLAFDKLSQGLGGVGLSCSLQLSVSFRQHAEG